MSGRDIFLQDDEIERLRSVLSRAYENPEPRSCNVFQEVKERISDRLKKKAIAERAESERKKDAA